MPRFSRKISATGYYHVMIRGVNRQDIFIDDSDRSRFINTLKRFSNELDIGIIVYCLMTNHIHLILYAPDRLDNFVKKISSSYVYYFNRKYDRVGHLFQDRFRSEVIESDSYLLTASRYVLQNPLKANISSVQDYHWSNWQDVVTRSGFTKPDVLYDLAEGYYPLTDYLLSENEDTCLDIEENNGLSEAQASEIIHSIAGETDPAEIIKLPAETRNALLSRIKSAGVSIRQISQFTGIDRNIIQRAR